MNVNKQVINDALAAHPHPLLFVTISGAHLYGFDSANSDYDLRGAHITPVRKMIGLAEPNLTHEVMDKSQPIEIDLVTHDIRKFCQLLLKNNGYVLEQVMSPIILHSTPAFEELKSLASQTITRHHHHHFRNFAQNQWDSLAKATPTVKGLLYAFRVVLAGIHLMETHQVESNLRKLNESFKLSYVDELIARKVGGQEKDEFKGESLAFYESE
ncbi:MAG TPA: nucleotidyltransferase domain-containing protein, partial [Tepidisphaeraceae bacterium]|nr:nucleotidyltransferase domain-containing protein [Tepidisphaeraceae bacterium]